MYMNRNVCVIIPALNEAPSIGRVIDDLFALSVCSHGSNEVDRKSILHHCVSDNKSVCAAGPYEVPACGAGCQSASMNLVDHIIVCDNGSTDRTAEIARAGGAQVVLETQPGYGAACQAALDAAPEQTDIFVFVDADYSVVADELPELIHPVINGADLVIGSRTLGHCERGALSLPQRYGNHLASVLIGLFWRARVSDLGPFRAITKEALRAIDMQDRQFGWTVEMQIRALQLSQTMVEIPVSTRKRVGKSKISGTVKGVIGASRGILGTIFKLYWVNRATTSTNAKTNQPDSSTSERVSHEGSVE